MTEIVVNSEPSLQLALGDIRQLFAQHKYLSLAVRCGTDRSLPQNSFTHAWYGQLARELREDDEAGWKSYCKLHHGVPILRQESPDFRTAYDASIKLLTYEQKLQAMRFFPVTSLMTKDQLSRYAEAVQKDFDARGVRLEFPKPKAKAA